MIEEGINYRSLFEQLSLFSFMERKIQDNSFYVAKLFLEYHFDDIAFGELNPQFFVEKKLENLYQKYSNSFNLTQDSIIQSNLRYIKETLANHFFDLVKTPSINPILKQKHQYECNYLYIDLYTFEEIVFELLKELKNHQFDKKYSISIMKRFGFEKTSLLTFLSKNNLLAFKCMLFLIKLDVKPKTSGCSLSMFQKYSYYYNLKKKYDELLLKDSNELIEEILSKKNLLPLDTFLGLFYNNSEISIIKSRIKKYQDNIDSFKKDKFLEIAIREINKYRNNEINLDETILLRYLSFIRNHNEELYKTFIHELFDDKAYIAAQMFLNGSFESISKLLAYLKISFTMFNIYLECLPKELRDKISEQTKLHQMEGYQRLTNCVEEMLHNYKLNNLNEVVIELLLKKYNIVNVSSIIKVLSSLIKKNNFDTDDLRQICKKLMIYEKDIEKYDYQKKAFEESISELKMINDVKVTSQMINGAISYLIDNGIRVNYKTVRSVIINYVKTGKYDIIILELPNVDNKIKK